jgi:hypothetical protein
MSYKTRACIVKKEYDRTQKGLRYKTSADLFDAFLYNTIKNSPLILYKAQYLKLAKRLNL